MPSYKKIPKKTYQIPDFQKHSTTVNLESCNSYSWQNIKFSKSPHPVSKKGEISKTNYAFDKQFPSLLFNIISKIKYDNAAISFRELAFMEMIKLLSSLNYSETLLLNKSHLYTNTQIRTCTCIYVHTYAHKHACACVCKNSTNNM